MEKINIFWTGGYDSTYRILELSHYFVEISPIYIRDRRKCEPQELNAIQQITKIIRSSKSTKCKLNDIRIYESWNIPQDETITLAWGKANAKFKSGSQYDWLARLMKAENIHVELGYEKSDSLSKFEIAIQALFIKKSYATMDNLTYYELDRSKINKDNQMLFDVFGNFIFPLPLFSMTKSQALERFKDWNHLDIVELTWFCHTPIHGKPCGKCHPCAQVMESGMNFRIPTISQIRYHLMYTSGYYTIKNRGMNFLRKIKKAIR